MNTAADSFFEALGAFLVVVLIMVALGAITSLPTMFLWNWLVPAIFSLPSITWLQAWGLNMLSLILFRTPSVNRSEG